MNNRTVSEVDIGNTNNYFGSIRKLQQLPKKYNIIAQAQAVRRHSQKGVNV